MGLAGRYFTTSAEGGGVAAAEARMRAQRELRYYVRFIVVCLLTNRRAVLRTLLTE